MEDSGSQVDSELEGREEAIKDTVYKSILYPAEMAGGGVMVGEAYNMVK